jgi:hypothetical protein
MQGVSHSLRVLFAGLVLVAAGAAAKADCVSACQASTYCDSEMNASGECGRRLNDCYINECNKTLYGALAYDAENGDYGWSADFANQAAAEQTALSGCSAGSNCKIVYDFWNSCAALAAASDGSYAIEGGDNQDGAQRSALASCEKNGGQGCKIQVWSCTNN